MGTIAEDNFLVWNQGKNPLVNFNFMLRVELLFDLPCKSVRAFTREMEYDYIQEGGLNDYVHMRRKPITKPFTLEVERYVGVDYVDPMPLGGDLTLPVLLFVGRAPNQFIPGLVARTYVFTGCTVMKKVYGELVGDKSGLLVETTTLGYREMLVVNIPWSTVKTDIGAEYATPATNSLQSESRLNDLKARSRRAAEQAEADAAAAKRMISEAEGLLSRMGETAGDENENEEDLIGALNAIYLKIEGGQAADSEAEPDQLPLVQSNNSAVQSTSDLATAETHFQKVMSASQGIAACKQEIQSKVEMLRSKFNASLEQEQTAQADPSEREARRQRAAQAAAQAAEQAAREAAEREALRAREREAEEQREQERQAAREAAQREREARAQEEAQERRQAEEAAEAALAAELAENAAAREERQAKARAAEEAAQGAGSADGTGAADGADDAGHAQDAGSGPDGQDTQA